MSTFEKTLNNALQLTFTTLFFILIAGNVWGQTCYTGHAPEFSSSGYSTGGDPDYGGSPQNTTRLASGKQPGSVLTTATGVTAGSVTVRFRAKGWSGSENSVTVTIDGQSVLYTGLTTTFAWHEIVFPGVSEDPVLSFSTTSGKRLHIGNVEIICALTGPSHDVIFNANGGAGTMANQTIAEGGSANLNSNTFTRSGYVFAGWNTNADGSGISYADGDNFNMGSADVTLYAQWDVYVGPCVEEDFGGIGSSSGYGTRTWTGDGGTWTATVAREDQTINGKAIAFRGTVTSPNVPGGIGSLTITTKYPFSDGTGTVTIRVNGVDVGTVAVSTSAQTFTINNINISGNVVVEIVNGTSKRPAIDDLSWTCYDDTPVCTPAATIFSFSPSSGPAETVVTITGSGFNGATAVKFGTTDAINFTIIDDNTITAKVPHAISETENISVFDASDCEAVSSSNYLLISDNDQCNGSPNFTDLFISEIYDSEIGSLGYIELFNPTSAPIDLSALNYRLYRFGDITSGNGTNPTPTYNIPLTGTVAPNSTFVIKFGSDSGDGCSPYPTSNQNYDDGFNDDDRFFLMKNGVRVDDISLPNYKGYNATRNTDATAPSVASGSYPTEGWTYTSSETCSNIGDYVVPVSSPAFDITHPDDVYAIVTPASFTMSVTPSGGTNPTYQWYFNDPISNNWLAVTSANLPGSLIVSGANTENLEISGSVSDIDAINNYQFYCEVKDGTCEIPSDAALFTIDNMLPVTLTSFHATCANEKGSFSSIVWNTASESNSSHFVVEKSRDGINWGFVGEKQAAGQSNSDISYYFIDENPFNGISYYRLRQVDYEGKEWIYGPISVRCEGQIESDISIYPNPNNGKFTIEISNSKADDNATLQLSDLTGKIIASERISLNKGTTQFFIDYPSLASGTYFVNLIGENSVLKRLKVVIGL